jgi:hypothetical protein
VVGMVSVALLVAALVALSAGAVYAAYRLYAR